VPSKINQCAQSVTKPWCTGEKPQVIRVLLKMTSLTPWIAGPISRRAKATRSALPLLLCGWSPRKEGKWFCTCGNEWNTLDTGSVLPRAPSSVDRNAVPLITFTYDSSFRIKTATDNIGRVVQYTYWPSGALEQVIDANGGTWNYGYDPLNRMTTIEDPRSITYLTNSYTSAGMVYQQLLADQTSYYQFNWTTTSNTQNTVFAYASGSGGPAPYDVVAFHDCTTCNEGFAPLVSQVQVVDPRGYTRQVNFNQNGYPTTDTLALGKPEQETTKYTYYADNLINTVTDQLDRITTYNYDINGNTTSATWSSGTQFVGTQYSITANATYDSVFSDPLTLTDPLGNTTAINYDTYGNATSVIDPLGHQTTFAYNGMGLPTSITDACRIRLNSPTILRT